MLNKSLFLYFFMSFALTSHAEYQPPVTYEKYIQTVTVHSDGTYEEINEGVTLIETKKGVNSSSTLDLEFNPAMEKTEIIEAYTLTPEGKRINVSKDKIRVRDDPIDGGADMFTGAKHKVLIFPDIAIGSRICYKMKITHFKTEFKGQFFYTSVMSPTQRNGLYKIKFIIDKKIPVKFDVKDIEGGLIRDTHKDNIYEFAFNRTDILPPESGSVSIYDFAPHIFVSSFQSQEALGDAYQKIAYPKTKPSGYVQGLADMIIAEAGGGDKRAEAKAFYEWVVKNIRYVAVYVGNGGIEPHDAETIAKNGYGDCKDHAVILEALLRTKGIKSSPALINSGVAYTLPAVAVLAPHNHVITYLPEFDLYADSTTQFTPFGQLPYWDQDKPVILAALNLLGRTPKMQSNEAKLNSEVTLNIKEDGFIEGKSRTIVEGSLENGYRRSQHGNLGKDDQQIVTDRLSGFSETGYGEITATEPTDFKSPFKEETTFTLDPVSNFPGQGAIKVPVGLAQGRIFIEAQDKPKDKINFPFSCASKKYNEHYTINFPSNVRVTRIPPNTSFKKDGLIYKADYVRSKNTVDVKRELIYEYPSMSCKPSDQENLKDLFANLRKDLMSQIFYE